MVATNRKLVGRLALEAKGIAFLGDTRIRLLEAIDKHGSLVQAAKAVPLSYKAAWDALEAMNNLADKPLVVSTTGGRHGGGTQLTAYGLKMIAVYRALQTEYQAVLDRIAEQLDGMSGDDVRQLQTLVKRMGIKTSARNQFLGVVTALEVKGIAIGVRLRIDRHHEITAALTKESVENLGLQVGSEAIVLVKASSTTLHAAPPTEQGLNILRGQISAIHEGAQTAEVTLALAEGPTATAVTTPAELKALGLSKGGSAYVSFTPSSVTLATYV